MSTDTSLKTVVLNDQHIAQGGKMVEFGGYSLPIQYSGIMAEHKWTREHAGLFDVSHMGPCFLTLNNPSGDAEADHAAVAALVEPLICGDIKGLKPGQNRYTLLLNAEGGALDDLMIGRSPLFPGSLYIVVNAGTKEADFALIAAAAAGKATFTRADNGALLALQGPEAVEVIKAIAPGAADLSFMTYAPFDWRGDKLIIARSGYTGEDGYEILCDAARAPALWAALLADERVKPIGLGARDSLRLEAGLCLHGQDITPEIDPASAGLMWAIPKAVRTTGGFVGAEALRGIVARGPSEKRVGLKADGRLPVRGGTALTDEAGKPAGRITSGGFGPSAGHPVAMGYVPAAIAAAGTRLYADVRGTRVAIDVHALPFTPHRYRKG